MIGQYSFTTCRTPTCRTTPIPGYADRGLCTPCELGAIEAIGALPDDYVDLQPLIWDKLTRGLGTPGGTFGPSEPVDLGADALAGEIAYTCVQWAEIVADRAGLYQPGGDVFAAASMLIAHFSAIVATPTWPVVSYGYERRIATMDGVDATITLTSLHRRARSRIGETDHHTTTALPGNCGNCSRPNLTHRDGGDDISCSYCHTASTWDDYQDLIALMPPRRVA